MRHLSPSRHVTVPALLVVALALGSLPLIGGNPAAGAEPDAYARGVTGGDGRPTVTVRSLADHGSTTLRAALDSGGGDIRFAPGLEGTIPLVTTLFVPANTTIDGAGANVTVTGWPTTVAGASNVIIRNLTFDATKGASDGDAISIRDRASRVWIDHNTFGAAIGDGAVDITRGATDVELSWNFFRGGRKLLLTGAGEPTGTPELVRVSVHHNLMLGTHRRNPYARHGYFDVRNNVIDGWGGSYPDPERGAGIEVGCGAQVASRGNAFLATVNTKAVVVYQEEGCDPSREPAIRVEDSLLQGGAVAESYRPETVFDPAAQELPAAAAMTDELIAAIRAGVGANGSGETAPTTTSTSTSTTTTSSTTSTTTTSTTSTTVAPTTTVKPTTTTTGAPPTTPPSGDPEVQLRRDGPRALIISWTAVNGAGAYQWEIRTCAGALIVHSTTTALTKRQSGVGPGCYQGGVRAAIRGSYLPWAYSNTVTL